MIKDLERGGAEEARLAHNQKAVGSIPTPATTEDELRIAIEKGTKAWADVPNIAEFVAHARGRCDDDCKECRGL